VAGTSLALLTVLLLLLGGLLDGLFLGSTGAFRSQDADVFVYSSDARESFLRSRIGPELRSDIEAVDGVESTGGLGVALVAGAVGDRDDLLDVAALGYEAATERLPAPPEPGRGYADRMLRASGVERGEVVEVGPAAVPVEVVDFVDDSGYLLQGSLWVDADTWRAIQTSSRPDAAIADGVFQVVLVQGDGSLSAEDLAVRIDEQTDGDTTSLTRDEAVFSLPGTREQNSTFAALIGTTFFVVGLITALFFVLLTVERTRLFAAVKALGVPSSRLVLWSLVQAVIVAGGAFAVGLALTLPLAAAIPDQIPLRLESGRAVSTLVILLVTAAVGSLLTLRRIIRIEPASAIS
jgi:putative ABC transport system permease protein